MKEFDEEGIQELTGFFDDDLQRILDRMDLVADAGKAYRSFAGAGEAAEGSVKFIIETGSIEQD